jgi:hypothetical protein
MMANKISKRIPAAYCSACGGDWFRLADYYEFQDEDRLVIWPGWPDLTGQATMTMQTVAVCLCGMPLTPSIGGQHAGLTPNFELHQFLDSLAKGQAYIRRNDGQVEAAGLESAFVRPAELEALAERLKNLERQVGRLQRSTPKAGRYWRFALPEARFRCRRYVDPRSSGRTTSTIRLSFSGATMKMAEKKSKRYTCAKCGSTMFVEGKFRQYQQFASREGNVEVAEFKRDAIRALTCICGQPMAPGRMRRQVPGDLFSFDQSFDKSVCHRKAREGVADLVSASFVTKEQLGDWIERVTSMEKIVKGRLPTKRKESGS